MNDEANTNDPYTRWGINHFPRKLYKISGFLTILTLILSSCVNLIPTAPAPSSELPNLNNTKAQQVEPTVTYTAAMIPTKTSQPVSIMEKFLQNYSEGNPFDVSNLNPKEFSEFSTRLAEQKNANRGINPVIYNNNDYVNPDNFKLMNYDGHPDGVETIKMYLPIAGKDDEGNLQIVNQNGKITVIEGSADVEWGTTGKITDPNDPRLDWPKLEPNPKSGLTTAQYPLSSKAKYPEILIPVILLDKGIGQIYLEGKNPRMQETFHFLTIETDSAKNAILARLVIIFPGPIFRLFEEGSSDRNETTGGGKITDWSNFYKNISENSVYYASIVPNQDVDYSDFMFTEIKGYQGIVAGNEAFSVFTSQTVNNKDIIVLAAVNLIKTSK